MAEIKSTLEIALERAAAMGGGDRETLDREEAARRGKVAGRRVLNGNLKPAELVGELADLAPGARQAARAAAAQVLLDGVPDQKTLALPALKALCEGTPAEDKVGELVEAVTAMDQAITSLAAALAAEQAERLKQAGITGSAVKPNPLAHPDYEARSKQAVAEPAARLAQAKQALRQALEA